MHMHTLGAQSVMTAALSEYAGLAQARGPAQARASQAPGRDKIMCEMLCTASRTLFYPVHGWVLGRSGWGQAQDPAMPGAELG